VAEVAREELALSVVVPVYNEGPAVADVLRELDRAISKAHEIIVVYDFPEDSTVPIIEQLQQQSRSIHGLLNERGRGVLNAMRAGIDAARAPYILVSMADGSDEPVIVDRMLALAESGASVVAASRYMPGGRQLGGPPVKGALSRLAGLSLHHVAGLPIHDPTNNFKLYARSFLDGVEIESSGGFELALELSVKAWLERRRLAEVPTTWHDRTSGTSNFQLRRWLPHYLRWYRRAMLARLRGR
jgi:glycosyltransferase involved in cell wall biosynthesis